MKKALTIKPCILAICQYTISYVARSQLYQNTPITSYILFNTFDVAGFQLYLTPSITSFYIL